MILNIIHAKIKSNNVLTFFKMKKIILLIFVIALIFNSCKESEKNFRKVNHVLVLGIDGLGAHGVEMSKTPNIDKLMKGGASTLHARTVVPSVSGPAWSSFITGATVERHGIGKNGWTVDNKTLEPVYKGEHNMFPTIFGEIRKNYPDAYIGAVYHWSGFGKFIEKDVCSFSFTCDTEDITTQKACEIISEKKPDFMLVHLDNVDGGGHSGGYRSEEYVRTIEKTDSLIGVFLNTLENAGILDETVVFVVSDHGGYGTSHGGTHPDEMIVPFIISGKNVKSGYVIDHPVFTYDLAPTVAWLFGFQLNEWISGKALTDAFIQ